MNRHAILAAVLAAASLASPALAADLPVKARPIVAPVVQDWSGVYVGIEGGYGWGNQDLNVIDPGDCFSCDLVRRTPVAPLVDPVGPQQQFFPDVALGKIKQRGWLFGGFAGAQKQWGSWVLGIEADFDAADIKGSETASAVSNFDFIVLGGENPPRALFCASLDSQACLTLTHKDSIESKIDMLGSLRGKVGFVPAPDWLIYGTGGLAYAHVENTSTATESVATEVSGIPTGTFSSFSGTAGTSMLGWAAGAGVDWKFPIDPGSALVLGVEYLHYGFPEHTITITDNAGRSGAFTATESVDTIRGRISYLFSIH